MTKRFELSKSHKNILASIYFTICSVWAFYLGFGFTNAGAAALAMIAAVLCSCFAAGHWIAFYSEWKPKKEAGKVLQFSKGSQKVDSSDLDESEMSLLHRSSEDFPGGNHG